MDKKALAGLFGVLLERIPEDTIRDIIDTPLDKLEDKVQATANVIDDALVLPLIALIRKVAGIEDKKYGTDKEGTSGAV